VHDLAPVPKEALAAAEHHRVDHQPVLVHQLVLQQAVHQAGTAVDQPGCCFSSAMCLAAKAWSPGAVGQKAAKIW
jgi:hypothetical protein